MHTKRHTQNQSPFTLLTGKMEIVQCSLTSGFNFFLPKGTECICSFIYDHTFIEHLLCARRQGQSHDKSPLCLVGLIELTKVLGGHACVIRPSVRIRRR